MLNKHYLSLIAFTLSLAGGNLVARIFAASAVAGAPEHIAGAAATRLRLKTTASHHDIGRSLFLCGGEQCYMVRQARWRRLCASLLCWRGIWRSGMAT